MGIAVIGFAMGGPACMANTDSGGCMCRVNDLFEIRNFACLPENGHSTIKQGNTSAVVAPVFQPLEAFNQYWISFFFTNISYNTTHNRLVICQL